MQYITAGLIDYSKCNSNRSLVDVSSDYSKCSRVVLIDYSKCNISLLVMLSDYSKCSISLLVVLSDYSKCNISLLVMLIDYMSAIYHCWLC